MGNEPGVWEPKKAVSVDVELLRRFAGLMMLEQGEGKLSAQMPASDVVQYAGLMKLRPEQWAIADSLIDIELEALIRFFTLAEMQLAGWDGGKDSPVIPLVKLLKGRGKLTADLRKWIKANTDNRYLPYGSAL